MFCSQLSYYNMTVAKFVKDDLAVTRIQTELRNVKNDILAPKKKLAALQSRTAEIEQATGKIAAGLQEVRG